MTLSTESLNKPEWDYTNQAQTYHKRPNYCVEAIEHLAEYVGANTQKFVVADIGAGTANLTKLMHDKASQIYCVEPNYGMRKAGIKNTKSFLNVNWIVGSAEATTLSSQSVDLAAFGSSFNTTDRSLALRESHRIIKEGGYFCCMWNNRDLTIPTQSKTEEIIRKYYPAYSHGTRREQQADIILESRIFNHIYFFERPQNITVSIEDFCDAWRSVTNQHWDLNTQEGRNTMDCIIADIKQEFKGQAFLDIKYITRVWIAQKVS